MARAREHALADLKGRLYSDAYLQAHWESVREQYARLAGPAGPGGIPMEFISGPARPAEPKFKAPETMG